jgi:preprotein translocase subunit SecD
MTRPQKVFLGILVVTLAALYVDMPRIPIKIHYGPLKIATSVGGNDLDLKVAGLRVRRDLKIKKGLDLQGGVQLVLEASMSGIPTEERSAAIEAAKNVIERRVNFLGVAEPLVQTAKVADSYRVIVELPGVTDTQRALDLIGQTAQLTFREQTRESTVSALPGTAESFVPTDLTGRDLKKAAVTFDPKTNSPQIALKFTREGGEKFAKITGRNVGRPLAIFLDNQPISAPRVNEAITGGEAVITGQFTLDEAKNLAIQLNAGALPVPVKVIEQLTIGPTLGQEAVWQSLTAGLLGLFLVVFFMIGNYGRLGSLAAVGLVIYGLLTLALYKLIPVTLTLSGVAGFLLSIGMAVDANILIFERIKEELFWGKPLKAALELGFGRAWDSIRDANVATLITCFILFNPFSWSFLNTSGIVRGFALTLGLGIFISLFTGIVVTRTLIRVFYR